MFSGLRSHSMVLSHVWLGLLGGHFFFNTKFANLSLECAHQYYQIVFTLFYSH